MYSHHNHKKSKSFFRRPVAGAISLGFLAIILFAAGLYHLRSEEWQKSREETVAVSATAALGSNQLKIMSRDVTIKSLSSGLEIGSATRGIENGIFYHTIKASLPVVDREKEFYEAWLLCQTPFDFFSTGEMVTNEDGEFVLEWAGSHNDIENYSHVIITREARDNNPVPGERVAEGGW